MRNAILFFLLLGFIVTGCKQEQKQTPPYSAEIESLLLNTNYSTDYESDKTNSIPTGWFSTVTGNNDAGHWELVANAGNKSVGQTSRAGSGYLFNLLVLNRYEPKNLVLSVNIKATAGKEDQGGGLVWRFQDNDNYYIARANPLENNFRLYKVINGNRKQLESYSLPVTDNIWHNIAVYHSADTIKCYYDGQLLLQHTDLSIDKAGKVGLWTKADAVTFFDNFQLRILDNTKQ